MYNKWKIENVVWWLLEGGEKHLKSIKWLVIKRVNGSAK